MRCEEEFGNLIPFESWYGVTLAPGETLAPGLGHAEADIVNFAKQNGLRLFEVGATRPICPACASLIEGAGARPVTPLKVP
jgi:filamentous hemagglutinin